MNPQTISVSAELGVAAAMEAERLSEKYGKDFFSCEDLVEIMGVGRNNIRTLMGSEAFPTIEIGNRKVVSVISFVLWTLETGRKEVV